MKDFRLYDSMLMSLCVPTSSASSRTWPILLKYTLNLYFSPEARKFILKNIKKQLQLDFISILVPNLLVFLCQKTDSWVIQWALRYKNDGHRCSDWRWANEGVSNPISFERKPVSSTWPTLVHLLVQYRLFSLVTIASMLLVTFKIQNLNVTSLFC